AYPRILRTGSSDPLAVTQAVPDILQSLPVLAVAIAQLGCHGATQDRETASRMPDHVRSAAAVAAFGIQQPEIEPVVNVDVICERKYALTIDTAAGLARRRIHEARYCHC